MILESKNFLALGLRPNGLYEYVDRVTGDVHFTGNSPDASFSPIDLVVNPTDISFPSRPREFLLNLRELRSKLLEDSRRERKTKGTRTKTTTTKGVVDVPSRTHKPSLSAKTQASLLDKFDPETAARLAELLAKRPRKSS